MSEPVGPDAAKAWNQLVLNVAPILIDCAKSKIMPCVGQIALEYCSYREPIWTEAYFPPGTLPQEFV
jgi:hypothetical protein